MKVYCSVCLPLKRIQLFPFYLTLQMFLSWTFSWIFIKENSFGKGSERQKQGLKWPADWKIRGKWQSLWERWELCFQGEPQEVTKIGKTVRRDSLHGSHCCLTLLWLKLTVENVSFPCCCFLSTLKSDAKASRAVFWWW